MKLKTKSKLINIPVHLFDALRSEAYLAKTSAAALIIDAVEEKLRGKNHKDVKDAMEKHQAAMDNYNDYLEEKCSIEAAWNANPHCISGDSESE